MFNQAFKELSAKMLGALNATPASFLDSYPEAAVLVSPDGAVIQNNAAGADLAALISEGSNQALSELLEHALSGMGTNLDGVKVGEESHFDITAVPVQDGTAILLLAHDQTFDRNMMSSLVDTRTRYKDL